MVDFKDDEAQVFGDSVLLEEGLAENALFFPAAHVRIPCQRFSLFHRDRNVMTNQSCARLCGRICIAK